MTLALTALAVFLGAALQSAAGFGFALVSAPILFALLGPRQAVSAGALVGIELSSLTLATERRVPRVLRGEAFALVAWSVPGLAIGAIALRELPDRVLSVLVALAVLGALGLRLRGRAAGTVERAPTAHEREPERDAIARPRRWSSAAAGLSTGALSSATSLSGPPLVLHLVARGLSPDQMRDTLAAVFVALAVLTSAALLISGTFEIPSGLVGLLGAGLVGQVVGRRAFAWLAGGRHEDAVLVVLAVTAIVALVSSVL
jgi:uncharacterized membrane protein YfcA